MDKSVKKPRSKRALMALGVTVLVSALIIIDRWIIDGGRPPAVDSVTPTPTPTLAPTVSPEATPLPTLAALPTLPLATPAPLPTETIETAVAPAAPPASLKLLIPVAGIRPEQLQDTFTQARSEGRVHNAIDIIAARGTPVLAATEGKVVKLFNSERGGITIYQLTNDQKTVLYYAHLDRYADGLTEGKQLLPGETIGYVGDTGNSGAGNYHLHFAIWLITDPKRYWDGENINPYLLLRPAQ